MTRLNAALNEVTVDVREGSLFEPVRGSSYDLLVTNPPFVVSPGTGELLVYRDSGLPGDEMVRRVVTGAPAHLNPGGVAQVLANWVHVEGRPWQERLEEWLAPRDGVGCDAWVVQREVADPAQYVELWLRDAGHDRRPDYARRYDAWVGWFEERGDHRDRVRLGEPPPDRPGAAVGAGRGVALRGGAAAGSRGAGLDGPDGAAGRRDRRGAAAPGRGGGARTCARRPSASPAPRTPR